MNHRPIPPVEVPKDFSALESALYGKSASTLGKGFVEGYAGRRAKLCTMNPNNAEGQSYLERLRAGSDIYSEEPRRRESWAFLFERHPNPKVADRFKNGMNNLIRVQTERALDGTFDYLIGWIQNRRLEGTVCQAIGLRSLNLITPEQLFKFSVNEVASITKFPAQLLTMARSLMPRLIARQIFSFRQVSTPNAKIPVMSVSYSEDHDPYDLGADVFLQTQGTSGQVFNPYYGGGRVLGFEVGTGDAATVNFNLPISEIEAATLEVYADGVLSVRGTDYTLGAGAGTDGRDRIVFAVAPGNGVAITANFAADKGRGNKGRELDIQISNVTLTDDYLKLTSTWDDEDEQDAEAFNNIVLSGEFGEAMSRVIEIQLEALVIGNAFRGAGGGNTVFDTSGFAPDDALTSKGIHYYNRRIVESFTSACDDLFSTFGRMPNYAIVGNNVANHLNNLSQFKPRDPSMSDMMEFETFEGGEVMGTWGGGIGFYRSNYAPTDKVLLGFTPETAYDVQTVVGIFRLYDTGVVRDGEANFTKRSSKALRYGWADVKPSQRVTVTRI